MKKNIIIIAILSLFTTLSCNKGGNTPVVPVAPQEASAGTVVFEQEATPVVLAFEAGTNLIVEQIEFMRGGAYVGRGRLVLTKAEAEGETIWFSGTYTEKDGAYKMTGDLVATLKMEENKVIIQTKEETVEAPADFTPAPEPETDVEKALCVSWRPTKVEATIKQHNITCIWNDENARDLHYIATFFKNHDFSVDPDIFEGYVINLFSLSPKPNGTISVSFTQPGIQPIVGNWEWVNMSERTFSYELQSELETHLIAAEANGSFSFKDGYNTLIIEVDVKVKEYEGKLTVTAERA